MSATATKRRKKAAPPRLGRTTYHVVDQAGNDLTGPLPESVGNYGAGLAVVRAQGIAQRYGEDGDEATLYVERRTIFGEPVELYRVVRNEDGSVSTFTTSPED